jgi:hypothetical protein
MSATSRGTKRANFDFYPTDGRIIAAFLRLVDGGSDGPPLPEGLWCEPAFGGGAIVQAVDAYRLDAGKAPLDWITVDINPETDADIIADFRDPVIARDADVYITNPAFKPFEVTADGIVEDDDRDALQEFAETCVDKAGERGQTCLLVRPGYFWNAKRRAKWIRRMRPDEYPIAPRPSFGLGKNGKKGTDATDYAILRFHKKAEARKYGPIVWR